VMSATLPARRAIRASFDRDVDHARPRGGRSTQPFRAPEPQSTRGRDAHRQHQPAAAHRHSRPLLLIDDGSAFADGSARAPTGALAGCPGLE